MLCYRNFTTNYKDLDDAYERQARANNKGRKVVRLNVGDQVMVKTHYLSNAPDGFKASLVAKWDGPHEIVEVKSLVVFR